MAVKDAKWWENQANQFKKELDELYPKLNQAQAKVVELTQLVSNQSVQLRQLSEAGKELTKRGEKLVVDMATIEKKTRQEIAALTLSREALVKDLEDARAKSKQQLEDHNKMMERANLDLQDSLRIEKKKQEALSKENQEMLKVCSEKTSSLTSMKTKLKELLTQIGE